MKEIHNDQKLNIFPKPTSGTEAMNILIKELLGADWYVVDPISHEQVFTIAVEEIIEKYKPKGRNMLQNILTTICIWLKHPFLKYSHNYMGKHHYVCRICGMMISKNI